MNHTPESIHALVIAKRAEVWALLRRFYPSIKETPPIIKYNKRLKTTAGRAFVDSNPQYIDLSTELLWSHTEEMVNETLPHELAHLVAFTVYGDFGHGKGWKLVMSSIGQKPERCHSMVNPYHEARKAKHGT